MANKRDKHLPIAKVFAEFGPIKRTRFWELRYQHRDDHWRILDFSQPMTTWPVADLDCAPGIGQCYPSEKVLLDDLERYAASYGADGSNKATLDDPELVALRRRVAELELILETNGSAVA